MPADWYGSQGDVVALAPFQRSIWAKNTSGFQPDGESFTPGIESPNANLETI